MQAEQHEDYAVITLPEVIDLINAPDFKNVLRSLYDQDCNNIRIDCNQLEMTLEEIGKVFNVRRERIR